MLDDIAAILRLDPSGVLQSLMLYPEQARAAVQLTESFRRPAALGDDAEFDSVAVIGFGGSAAAADALCASLTSEVRLPIFVVRSADLPAWIGPRTLAVIVSYSGDTSDALLAYGAAHEAGAKTLCVTSGGALMSRAAESQAVLLQVGLKPQCALPAVYFGLYAALTGSGVIPAAAEHIEETLALLGRQRDAFAPEKPTASNATKQLGSALAGTMPLIYAGSPLLLPVAERWRTQINVAAKAHAHSNGYPELTHNELMAWRGAREQSGRWAVVIVRDPHDPPAAKARIDAAADVIPADIPLHELYVDGRSPMARVWTGLYTADAASCYMAMEMGVDPSAD